MRKGRLRFIARKIEQSPEHFSMAYWLNNPLYYNLPGTQSPKEFLNTCGTTACIAGWAVCIYRPKIQIITRSPGMIPKLSQGRAYTVACQELDLTESQADILFYAHNWPNSWGERYYRAPSSEKARIAVAFIREFIRTDAFTREPLAHS